MSFIAFQTDQDVIPAGQTEVIGEMKGMGSHPDRIVGYFITDQAGNLTVEQSADGTNWDLISTYAVVANVGKLVSEEIVAPYLRVRFNNTAGTPTTFTRGTLRTSSTGPR